MDRNVRALVLLTTDLLAQGDYQAAANATHSTRFTAAELKELVEGLGRTLVELPKGWVADTTVTELPDQPRPTLAVAVDLWTVEDGHSDLVLRLLFHQNSMGFWSRQIDGIDVRSGPRRETAEPDQHGRPAVELGGGSSASAGTGDEPRLPPPDHADVVRPRKPVKPGRLAPGAQKLVEHLAG